jgi:hypothetical protein
MIYTDWPLLYLAWVLFCIIFWMLVQVLMLATSIRELEEELEELGVLCR